MSENLDPIDLLLLAASEELPKSPKETKILKETNIFCQESNLTKRPPSASKDSVIHSGETDSSDDEDRRNWEDKRYTDSGRDIKKILESTKIRTIGSDLKRVAHSSNWKEQLPSLDEKIAKFNPRKSVRKLGGPTPKSDVYTDPFFGIRIVNPLISSAVLQDRMVGREPITFIRLNRFLQIKTKDKDWVLAGVVVNKSATKTSQKGTQFSVWTLSDLKDDIKTVAVFLFSGAHQELWKTSVGTVVGLLNPNVLEKNNGRDEASLSVDNAQRVMILGQSKDFGICRTVKKNGEKCTAIVNTNRCEYCVYHIKQEYQKCSIRSDLQSTFGGRGLTALRNKVLGKNEVFYTGKSYTAIPAKRSRKLEQKDDDRLDSLHGKGSIKNKPSYSTKSGPKKRSIAPRLEVSHAQRMKDIQLLQKLSGISDLNEKNTFEGNQSSDVTLEEAKSLANSVLNKLKAKRMVTEINGTSSSSVDADGQLGSQNTLIPKTNERKKKLNNLSTSYEEKDNKLTEQKKNSPNIPNSGIQDTLTKRTVTEINGTSSSSIDAEADGQLGSQDTLIPKTNERKRKLNNLSTGFEGNDNKLTEQKNSVNIPNSGIQDSLIPKTNDGKKRLNKLNSSFEEKNYKLTEQKNKSANIPNSGIQDILIPQTNDGKKRLNNLNSSFEEKHNKLTEQKNNSNIPNSGIGNQNSNFQNFPKLSGFAGGVIDLNKSITPSRKDKAKLNAIKLINKTGPIKKVDPNNLRGTGVKRPIGPEAERAENEAKKAKVENSGFTSERFKKIMAAASNHQDLLEARDEEEKDKYFNKLEVKERMEEKMIGTHKLACKAVKCLQCKYTSFSASDLCKSERHPLKVFDAVKRFYKCGHCQNRTVCLELVPLKACTNCGSTNWQKTGMMKEKLTTAAHSLSIRGGEQKHLNSIINDANLNLLVPE